MRDFHLILHIAKNSGLNVVPLLSAAVSAQKQGGALLLPALNVPHDAFELDIVDLGALIRVFIEGIAYDNFFRSFDRFFHEFVVNFLVDEESGAGAAALALVHEQRELALLDGLVDVGVVANYVRRLSAQLEGDSFQAARGRVTHDVEADLRAAGEGDFVHAAVPDQVRANVAEAAQHLEHPGREAGQFGEVRDVERA